MASSKRSLSRRAFLSRTAIVGGALALPNPLWSASRLALDIVAVSGRVTARGQAVPRVPVTDGVSIVDTDASGRYELVSSGRQPYVYLSLPSGYTIPRNPTGTAHFYRALRPSDGRMVADFELEPFASSSDRHAFVALADPQTQDSEEMELFHDQTVPDVRRTVEQLGVENVFGISCGDIMFDNLSLYPDYERAVDRMGIPFFQVIGNHDLDFDGMTDPASAVTFRSHFGPTYYSFNRGAVHYVVLDDVFWNHVNYMGYLDAIQLGWLEDDLSRVLPGSPVVVVFHIPALSTRFRRAGEEQPSTSVSVSNRQVLYDLLSPFDAHVISGHTHENEHVFEGGVHEHVLGTACGAWWSGPICYDGTPNGYGVFEANGRELRWRYKSTGQAADHQMRVYPKGADPSAPDEIVANVWDWNPEWTVTWYESSVRRGLMARRVGFDPLAVKLHEGPDLPRKRSWVEPVPTDHMFYAPVDSEAGDIVVEATNRWGETFVGRASDGGTQ